MRRALGLAVVLAVSTLGLVVPGNATVTPARALTVTGTDVAMYPAFDPAIDHYALTTTSNTGGAVDVAATPGPGETVTVDGGTATHVTGLAAGDQVTIAFTGGTTPHRYTAIYLPAGFPQLNVTGGARSSFPGVEPGLIGLTLNAFDGVQPSFGAIVDRNGVPVYAVDGPYDTDLKEQPNHEVTVSRNTTTAGHTGYALVTLDKSQRSLPEIARRDVGGTLTNTDGHDSVRLPDGSTILIGYEPNASTGKTDATIQRLDANDDPVFTWSTGDDPTILDQSLAPTSNPDYAHVNSVVSVEDGDVIASFRHLSAAYRIATVAHDGYQPGDVIWKLGGEDSTFAFPDDPEGGPCAQHTVSELPNGHILVFDNGTSAFCTQAGTHGFTRVAEYALDLDAQPKPTASLVWSYPSDKSEYALFAGSARRMANGDTLIGWAADRNALATEVDALGQKVWELKAADPPAGKQRYATYRAALITTLEPRAQLDGPAEASAFALGDVEPGSATCNDWTGGGLLGTCETTGLVSGHLDTSTIGSHTWSVEATDGAGNTTRVVRHYTVRSGRRPDALIRKPGATWKGDGIYGSATGQSIAQRVQRRDSVTSYWRVQNDGERADTFRLLGASGNRRVRVHYFVAGTDVTAAVVAGTYVTARLDPGAKATIRVVVTATRRARIGSGRTVALTAWSSAVPTSDQVATRVTVRR